MCRPLQPCLPLRGGLSGERVIALRADMDALPVAETSGVQFASTEVDTTYPGGPFPVSHACGHDCHTAVVLTTARLLARMREQVPGTASCVVRIEIHGTQVHGSTPWMGADPMPVAAGIVLGAGQLYRQVQADHAVAVTVGHVEDVGRFNIIGGTVTLYGTIRCTVDADMALLQQRLRRLAEHEAETYGCSADVRYLQPVPAVVNQPRWLEPTLLVLREVLGAERIVEVPPTLGYDDMSVFVNAFGGLYLSYGVQDTTVDGDQLRSVEGGRGLVPNHHPAFYADEDSLLDAVRVHAHVALAHLSGRLTPDR